MPPEPRNPPSPHETAHLPLDIAAHEGKYVDDFRRTRPVLWLVTLIAPFVATLGALIVTYFIKGPEFTQKLVGTAFITFFALGRFVILGGQDADTDAVRRFLSPEELFAMVMWMDICVAMLFVYHAGFMFRIPFIGPRLAALVEDGQYILKSQRWMRRLTMIGLIAFVAFPLAATGSVGGSIFGRLLGLSRPATFFGIIVGSFVGCGAMYLGAEIIGQYINRDNPLLFWGGMATIALLVILLNMRYQKMKKQSLAERVSTNKQSQQAA